MEKIENGLNILVGSDSAKIQDAILNFNPTEKRIDYFGNGTSVEQIVEIIKVFQKKTIEIIRVPS